MEQLAAAVVATWIYMTGMFLAALKAEDNGVVDIAWGPGFVLIATLCTLNASEVTARQVLILVLVAAWGGRLAWHLYSRSALRSEEDFRYRAWRESWGKWFHLRSYVQIFMLQGVIMLMVAAPIIAVNVAPGGPLGLLDMGGFLLWAIGFGFQAVGDWQLLAFKRRRENKGAIITSGVWACTRHPNYFGEVTLWWGLFLIALASPYGWRTIISPLTITFLLLKVSGIPMLEKKFEGRADFEAYKQRTSAFLPWFPRKQEPAKGEGQDSREPDKPSMDSN